MTRNRLFDSPVVTWLLAATFATPWVLAEEIHPYLPSGFEPLHRECREGLCYQIGFPAGAFIEAVAHGRETEYLLLHAGPDHRLLQHTPATGESRPIPLPPLSDQEKIHSLHPRWQLLAGPDDALHLATDSRLYQYEQGNWKRIGDWNGETPKSRIKGLSLAGNQPCVLLDQGVSCLGAEGWSSPGWPEGFSSDDDDYRPVGLATGEQGKDLLLATWKKGIWRFDGSSWHSEEVPLAAHEQETWKDNLHHLGLFKFPGGRVVLLTYQYWSEPYTGGHRQLRLLERRARQWRDLGSSPLPPERVDEWSIGRPSDEVRPMPSLLPAPNGGAYLLRCNQLECIEHLWDGSQWTETRYPAHGFPTADHWFTGRKGSFYLSWHDGLGRLHRLHPGKNIEFLNPDFHHVHLLADHGAVAVGPYGNVRIWDGQDWRSADLPNSVNLYTAWGNDPGSLVVAGENGVLYRRDGTQWQRLDCGTFTLRAVDGTAMDNLYLADEEGHIYHFNGDQCTLMATEEGAEFRQLQMFGTKGWLITDSSIYHLDAETGKIEWIKIPYSLTNPVALAASSADQAWFLAGDLFLRWIEGHLETHQWPLAQLPGEDQGYLTDFLLDGDTPALASGGIKGEAGGTDFTLSGFLARRRDNGFLPFVHLPGTVILTLHGSRAHFAIGGESGLLGITRHSASGTASVPSAEALDQAASRALVEGNYEHALELLEKAQAQAPEPGRKDRIERLKAFLELR